MKNKAQAHLICYDIGEPKRLLKIHRFLKKQAIPVQYSVFYAKLTKAQRSTLINALGTRINEVEDDIRIYPLPKNIEYTQLGKTIWPNANFFSDEE